MILSSDVMHVSLNTPIPQITKNYGKIADSKFDNHYGGFNVLAQIVLIWIDFCGTLHGKQIVY